MLLTGGDVFVVTVTGGSPVGRFFSLCSWTFFLDSFLGLACRAADIVDCLGLVAFAEGLQFWGIGVASFVFPGSLCLLFWFLGNSIQCDLLVTRLGLMPCSA